MEQHHQLSSMEENIKDIVIHQQLLQNTVLLQELQESTDVDVVQILKIIEIIIELIIENLLAIAIVIVLGRQNQNVVGSIHIVKMN